jgi:hypothetical protein
VRSRFVVSVSGIILILMGVFSRMAALVVLIPKPILGGAGIVMFGMVAVSGIRTLGQVNYRNNNNGMVVALTLGLGMMPVLVPNLFTQFPPMVQLFLHSGITIGTLTAIVANLTLNGSVPFRVNHETPVPIRPRQARRRATWPSEPSECGSCCAKFRRRDSLKKRRRGNDAHQTPVCLDHPAAAGDPRRAAGYRAGPERPF